MHQSSAELRSFAESTRLQVSATIDAPNNNNNNNAAAAGNPACQKQQQQTPDFASMVQKTAEKFLLQFNRSVCFFQEADFLSKDARMK